MESKNINGNTKATFIKYDLDTINKEAMLDI